MISVREAQLADKVNAFAETARIIIDSDEARGWIKRRLRAALDDRPPPSRALTRKQHAVLQFIIGYRARHNGLSPSYDEVGEHLGVRTSSAKGLIQRIAAKGYVRIQPNQHRSVEPLWVP